jgi:protein-tyrosine-phosphatase
MAEGILKDRISRHKRHDFTISSMGIHGLDFKPANQNVIDICREHGIDISTHLSRPLLPDELRASNLIFVMEPLHKDFLNTFFPSVIDRVFLLGCWPGKETPKGGIADPIGGSIEQYRKSFKIIEKHIDRIIGNLIDVFPG